eukprot:TRINITY_DN31428_c0_g1_i2.p1 TRINITY_DN31428_c0_g1~~TRINITY_DN31428_c0_g1_i2.p1  ORF type:complete len:227 (+),score=51.82 TRINITY_DN31428_c0_g1_i2:211-891(+)
MATRPEDWDCTLQAYRASRGSGASGCGLGVHPWFAHLVDGETMGWLSRLEQSLTEHLDLIVGEIGLDKAAIAPETGRCEFDAQLLCFKAQLELAARMNRPVSVHNVRCHGLMFDIMCGMEALPPAIALHSYSGSADMAASFCKMKKFGDRFFFGFSAGVNLRAKKTLSVIQAIDSSRILLESDSNCLGGGELLLMCQSIASAKGINVEEVAQLTSANAHRLVSAHL